MLKVKLRVEEMTNSPLVAEKKSVWKDDETQPGKFIEESGWFPSDQPYSVTRGKKERALCYH
jgi:hypothetical protein